MKRWIWLLMLTQWASARTFETARILEVSQSGKTIVINYGSFDELKEGDKAEFLHRASKDSLETLYVGRGELIKVFSNHSYWYMQELSYPAPLVKNSLLLISTHKDLKAGETPPRMARKRLIVQDPKKLQSLLEARNNGESEDLAKLEKSYKASAVDIEEKFIESKEDVEVLDIDHIQTAEPKYVDDSDQDLESIYIKEYQKGPTEDEVKEYFKNQRIDKSVKDYVSKVNSPDFSLEEMYSEQEKDTEQPLFRSKHSRFLKDSKYLLSKEREKFEREAAMIEIERKGPTWSDEFSDKALRSFVIRKGLVLERSRQDYAINHRENHEFFLALGVDLDDQTTADDSDNRGVGFGFELGYELPFVMLSESLRHFSSGLSYKLSRTSLALNTVNAFVEEKAFKLYFNWYPFAPPTQLLKFLPYLGMGYRIGKGEFFSTQFVRPHTYDLSSFPNIHIGAKYRFPIKELRAFGLKAQIDYEVNRFVLNENDTTNEVPETVTVNDLKFTVGVSYYY